MTDYDYFSTCLYRSLHAILPTNLVKQKHQLVDVPTLPLNNPQNDYYLSEFNDQFEMTLFEGCNPVGTPEEKKAAAEWNARIIPEVGVSPENEG